MVRNIKVPICSGDQFSKCKKSMYRKCWALKSKNNLKRPEFFHATLVRCHNKHFYRFTWRGLRLKFAKKTFSQFPTSRPHEAPKAPHPRIRALRQRTRFWWGSRFFRAGLRASTPPTLNIKKINAQNIVGETWGWVRGPSLTSTLLRRLGLEPATRSSTPIPLYH